MPLAKVTAARTREAELHRVLREMRTAIDKYKDAADTGVIGALEIKVGSEGYPPDLETLVEGVAMANDATGRKLKFLRRIPVDPMTRSTEWGLRSYQDKPDTTRWGGQNVFDVYTTFNGKGSTAPISETGNAAIRIPGLASCLSNRPTRRGRAAVLAPDGSSAGSIGR